MLEGTPITRPTRRPQWEEASAGDEVEIINDDPPQANGQGIDTYTRETYTQMTANISRPNPSLVHKLFLTSWIMDQGPALLLVCQKKLEGGFHTKIFDVPTITEEHYKQMKGDLLDISPALMLVLEHFLGSTNFVAINVINLKRAFKNTRVQHVKIEDPNNEGREEFHQFLDAGQLLQGMLYEGLPLTHDGIQNAQTTSL